MIILLSQQAVLQRILPFYFLRWRIWNGLTSAMQLNTRCSTDGHSKSDTRDEAGTAQGGTNEVWRGHGPFTSGAACPEDAGHQLIS